MIPGFFGTAIYQVNLLVASFLAYSISDSAATLLFYSNRLMELPIGVFAIAISTVVYPLLARHAVERKFKEMAGDFQRGIRLILLINIPAAVGLALLSEPIIRLIFQHGKFKAADTAAMTPLLRLFVIGLPFFSITNLTVRAFYAVKDTATPVKIGLIDFGINLVLSVSLMLWLGAPGLVLASTTAIIVQTLLLQRALVRKLPGMSFAPLWPSVGKVMMATLAMGVVVWLGREALMAHWPGRRLADWLAVGGLIPLAVACYAGLLWILRIEGREEFVALLKGRREPKNENQN
jgi:putative peptidoglycan lipid II flippase